jgi:HD-like signal output (HDOD) protein
MKQSIIDNIKMLPPLSDSIKDIMRVCDDAESSLLDVVNVVKKDPTATATLLKIANSSLYGNRNVKIVDRAVGMFGKAVTKSFLVSRSVLQSIKIDLSPYNMDEEKFSNVSLSRVMLMSDWYGDIDRSKLEILATAVQIANIGQIFIARELINSGKANEFKQAVISGEDDVEELEIEFVGISSTEVTCEILRYWKLDNTMIDALVFSHSEESVSRADDETLPYAQACFAVLNGIDIVGKENSMHIEEVYDLLDFNDLQEARFVAILDQVRQNFDDE